MGIPLFESKEVDLAPEYEEINPPVIPCFFKVHKRLSSSIAQSGWEMWKVHMKNGKWAVGKTNNQMLYICPDGYCEIPATPNNKKRLEILVEHGDFRKVKQGARREFDRRKSNIVDRIRPWLRAFVSVDGVNEYEG